MYGSGSFGSWLILKLFTPSEYKYKGKQQNFIQSSRCVGTSLKAGTSHKYERLRRPILSGKQIGEKWKTLFNIISKTKKPPDMTSSQVKYSRT
jgi:hypothetical protein